MSAGASLVTGGAGFIGRHLVQLLLDRGERVRVLDIQDDTGLPPDAELVHASITDAPAVAKALDGMDRLYHLAGNPNLWLPDSRGFYEVNLEGTRTVLREAARCDLERIVYTSTESILKSYRRRVAGLVDETVELELADMPGHYCKSKYLAEHEAFEAARRGLPVVIVNPTLPVGPGDRNLTPPSQMILRFLRGETPLYLDCEMNLIDVRDVAHGHILAAERGRTGERYILGGENLRISQLLAMLGELSGAAMPRLRVPYWFAWVVGVTSELVADTITHKPPIAPLTGVRLAGSAMIFDCSKAVGELGLSRRPVREALADAVVWLAAEGHWQPRTQIQVRLKPSGVARSGGLPSDSPFAMLPRNSSAKQPAAAKSIKPKRVDRG